MKKEKVTLEERLRARESEDEESAFDANERHKANTLAKNLYPDDNFNQFAIVSALTHNLSLHYKVGVDMEENVIKPEKHTFVPGKESKYDDLFDKKDKKKVVLKIESSN